MNIQRKLLRIALFSIIAFTLAFITALSVRSEGFFEYYFASESSNHEEQKEEYVNDFLEALPSQIKDELPDDIAEGTVDDLKNAANEYINFSSILRSVTKKLIDSLFPAVKGTAVILGIVLISSLINAMKSNTTISDHSRITDTVINAAIVLSIVGTEIIAVTSVEEFKDLICGLMNGMVPVFGVVYAASGNLSTAAIHSGGMMLLVAICQNLFSMILMPTVRICIIISLISSVFTSFNIRPLMTAFKNIATGIILSVTTLFSFVLGMQNTVAQSADTFGAKSIKFAISQLVPIIGGTVSDSLSTVGGSLLLLKKAGGSIIIVAIVLLLVPIIADLFIRRFSVYLCKTFAQVSCLSSTEKLLDDLGSIISLLIAFVMAMSIAFIYMLTLFTNSVIALSV